MRALQGQTNPDCLVVQPCRLHMQAGRLRYKEDDRNIVRMAWSASS